MTDRPADEELHAPPERFTTPGVPEALTLEDYKRIMATRTRPLTMTDYIQRRRGSGNRNQINATQIQDFT